MTRQPVALPAERGRALEALSLLSKKWAPTVILTLDHAGPQGFNELLDWIPDVSSKVLSDTLESLQEAGLVERRVRSESPLRVQYALTDAGTDILTVFDALGAWGDRHLERATKTVLLADGDRRITEMYRQWFDDRYTVTRVHDDEELAHHLEGADAVLLDVGLPGVDPASFVEAYADRTRIILLVADRPHLSLLEVPCDDLLRKPFVRETALEAIDAQLSRIGESSQARERASLTTRRSRFESLYPRERLRATDSYRALVDRLEAIEGTDE